MGGFPCRPEQFSKELRHFVGPSVMPIMVRRVFLNAFFPVGIRAEALGQSQDVEERHGKPRSPAGITLCRSVANQCDTIPRWRVDPVIGAAEFSKRPCR